MSLPAWQSTTDLLLHCMSFLLFRRTHPVAVTRHPTFAQGRNATPLRISKAENGLVSFEAEVVRLPELPMKSEFLRILLQKILNGVARSAYARTAVKGSPTVHSRPLRMTLRYSVSRSTGMRPASRMRRCSCSTVIPSGVFAPASW